MSIRERREMLPGVEPAGDRDNREIDRAKVEIKRLVAGLVATGVEVEWRNDVNGVVSLELLDPGRFRLYLHRGAPASDLVRWIQRATEAIDHHDAGPDHFEPGYRYLFGSTR